METGRVLVLVKPSSQTVSWQACSGGGRYDYESCICSVPGRRYLVALADLSAGQMQASNWGFWVHTGGLP